MVLAEFLSQFLPGQVKTPRAYLISCLLTTALTGLIAASLTRLFAQPTIQDTLWWSASTAACVAAGYAVAYPFARKRLVKSEQ